MALGGAYPASMGIKDWLANAPLATFGGLTDQVVLHKDRVQRGGEDHPLTGVTARVESGSDLEKRVTVTRLVALGVFSLMAKKKSGGEAYLTVEGPDFFWTVEVERKKRAQAQSFAAKVNDQARKVTA